MKTIIFYFSRSGHNKKVAEELAAEISAEIEEIVDLKPKNYIMSGFSALKKKKTPIKDIVSDFSKNDRVILCYPIWPGGLPPAVRTFIEENMGRIGSVALLSVSGGGQKNEHYLDEIEKQYGLRIEPRLMISDEEFSNSSYTKKLDEFSKNL